MPGSKPYQYDNFVLRLSAHFAAQVGSIHSQHAFGRGREFEQVLRETLSRLLPSRYAVCTGTLVASDGRMAGDDIIIFAHDRIPTLALRDKDDAARQDFIPIESAYAYIEAKHSVVLDDDTDDASLCHAHEQVSAAVDLCSTRAKVPLYEYQPGNIDGLIAAELSTPPHWPHCRNPMLGGIIARYIRFKNRDLDPENPEDVRTHLRRIGKLLSTRKQGSLNFAVLGQDWVALVINPGEAHRHRDVLRCPFTSADSLLVARYVPKKAFGVAFTVLSGALDWIQLGPPDWVALASEATGDETPIDDCVLETAAPPPGHDS